MASSAQYMTYRFGSFVLDLERGALLAADGKEMPLRPKSFALLRLLVENAGRLLSREAIMEALWQNVFVTEDNVTQCIHDIRGALGAGSHEMLRTMPRRGYILALAVTPVPSIYPLPVNNGIGERGDIGVVGRGAVKLRENDQQIGEGSEAQTQFSSAPLPVSSGGHPKLTRRSVAMALLQNFGVPEEHLRLVEGISHDIAAVLSRLGVSVVSCVKTVFHVSNSPSPKNIAREAGVGYVIQGSIRGTSDAAEVHLQLINGEIGVHLWSERLAIDLRETTDARNEIIHRMAWTLFTKLIEDVNRCIEALPPEDRIPSDFIDRGLALLFRPLTPGRRFDAIENFEQALAADPGSVAARIGLASALVTGIADWWGSAAEQDEARAEQLLLDTLRMYVNIPSAHALMGMLRRFQGRLDDARIELEIAVGLDPNYAYAIGEFGATLITLGDPEAAIPLIERCLRLAPVDVSTPAYRGALGACHLLLGNFDDAITFLKTARALSPALYYTHWYLAGAVGLKGELDEADTALRQAIKMRPEVVTPPRCYVFSRQPSPRFVTLFEKTVCAGLLRAGLPAIRPGA